MHVTLSALTSSVLVAGLLAGASLAATPLLAQGDPPPGAARVARIEGNVSFQPNGEDAWGQASTNMPASSGDRLFSDGSGRGELQASQVRAYFSGNSDLTLINLSYQGVELGAGQGSFVIFSDGFPPGSGFSVQTPNGAITVATKAGFRVDVYPDQQSTIITNLPNWSRITLNGGGGFYMDLEPGQSVELTGTNPVLAQPMQPAPYDGFAEWAGGLETHRFNSVSAQYVSTELPGYDLLDAAGEWQPQSQYGPVWFPRVEAGWAPYHFGHWVHMPFYGWTWVADEPWGAAPFHYGRWVTIGGRWGWIPGPREGHPIWSPAQVVFAGGVSIGGAGVSVWFPLGPGEAYKPWYPCSPTYINQINITNIHESSVVHVQTNYVNIVNVTNVTNVTYVNRTVGVTAMKQEDFASGHPAQAAAIKVAPQQLEHIQVARPEAPAPAQRMILHPAPKPAAAPAARPVLINAKGEQAVATPHATPMAVPVKAAPPAPKPIPGHVATGTPTVGNKPAPQMAPKAAPAAAAKPEMTPAAKAAPQPKAAPAMAGKPEMTPKAEEAKPGTKPAPAAAKPEATQAMKPAPKPAEAKPVPAKPGEAKPADDKSKKKDDKKKTPPEKPE